MKYLRVCGLALALALAFVSPMLGERKPDVPTMASIVGEWVGIDEGGELCLLAIRTRPKDGKLVFAQHGRVFERSIEDLSLAGYDLEITLAKSLYGSKRVTVSGFVTPHVISLRFRRGETTILHRREQFLSDMEAAMERVRSAKHSQR